MTYEESLALLAVQRAATEALLADKSYTDDEMRMALEALARIDAREEPTP
jgi:hypothetical protein